MQKLKKFILLVLKNIAFIILGIFVFFILLSCLNPSNQWYILISLPIFFSIFSFFTIFENIYDLYLFLLENSYLIKEKIFYKKYFFPLVFLITSILVWNFKLYLEDANYLILALMVIPYIKENNKNLFKDIFSGILLYFICSFKGD